MKNFTFFILLASFLSLKFEFSKAQFFQEAANVVKLNDLTKNNGNAVADFDLDGDLDIFMVALKSYAPGDQESMSRLMRNDGYTFTDITKQSGFTTQYANKGEPGIMGQKMGASWGDFDNDGFPDLVLTHFRKVQLYHNDGNGFFNEVTLEAGIEDCYECYFSSALWWDYDKDGDLDLYLSNWDLNNILYQNNGDGTFTDKSKETKLGDKGNTWTSIPIDVNQDGWQDLYVVNDFFRNLLYINEKGKYFTEATIAYGLEDFGNGMGVCTGDYNGDGIFDIYLTNIFEHYPNPLFTGTSKNKYVENALDQGVDDAGWAWGTSFFDADLDGDEDLYVVNGHSSSHHQNKFYKNMRVENQEKFKDWTANSQTGGELDAMSLTTFDYDNDGDLDMLVSNTNGPPYFYRNEVIVPEYPASQDWLKVMLEGTVSNRDGLGSILTIYAGEKTFHRFYHGAALLGQSLQPVHFGLGNVTQIDSLVITWPNSGKEVFTDFAPNQTIKVTEGKKMEIIEAKTVTGIEDSDFSSPHHFSVYPNPFHSAITFDFGKNQGVYTHFEIYNIQGKKVFAKDFPDVNKFIWDGRNMAGNIVSDGIYYFKSYSNRDTNTGKILKKSR